MLERFIYDTSSVQDRQFQGPATTLEQQRRNMQRKLDNFDRQLGSQGTKKPSQR